MQTLDDEISPKKPKIDNLRTFFGLWNFGIFGLKSNFYFSNKDLHVWEFILCIGVLVTVKKAEMLTMLCLTASH